ncbi:MAG: ABC transporter ATP-binding protein [Nitrospiraceae bacterium]
MAEVKIEKLSKRFRQTEVIIDLTLTVHEGELFTIVGPSGCGKSTLLHVLAGLETPTEGRILFDGEDVTMLSPRSRDVALVFQNYALYPHMTVEENLAFPLLVGKRLQGKPSRDDIVRQVRGVAEMMGLSSVLERRPRELSGGQRQRVALGRALIRQPRVFLLDEPLSNLDAQLRAGMRAELRRLHDELRATMICVTHDQTDAMTLSDRVAVLDRGRLQQLGHPRELYDRPANVFVAGFIGSPAMNLMEAELQNGSIRTGPLRVPIPHLVQPRDDGTAVTLGIRPEHVHVTSKDGSPTQPGQTPEIPGFIRLIEPTGGQTWVTVEIGTAPNIRTVTGLAASEIQAKTGDRVGLSVMPTHLHLFDPITGLRRG